MVHFDERICQISKSKSDQKVCHIQSDTNPAFKIDLNQKTMLHYNTNRIFFIIWGSIWRKSVVYRLVNNSVIETSLGLKSPGRSGRELWVETRLRNRCRTVGVVISAQTLHLPTEQYEHSKTQCAFPYALREICPKWTVSLPTNKSNIMLKAQLQTDGCEPVKHNKVETIHH